MKLETLKNRVQKFVWAAMICPEEWDPMTSEDATESMKEWKKEGLTWPKGMTPEMLAELWNTEII